jgi:deazaflavin-dependent oxidoreductase (nitroreductase family)
MRPSLRRRSHMQIPSKGDRPRGEPLEQAMLSQAHVSDPVRPPRGTPRAFLRLPICFYRIGLGWLFGDRLLLLHHRGRKSGRLRRTVLEVIRRDERTDTYVVASGWGEQPQWVRNVMARPDVVIQTGRRVVCARASRLPADQAAQEIARYARRHPVLFPWGARWLGWKIGGSEDLGVVGPPPPVFALRPTSLPSEPVWLATAGSSRPSERALGCHWA